MRNITARCALWEPSRAALVAMTFGLVCHELAYHLAGGEDYPLIVHADGTTIFALSHGGLDALGVGLLIIAALYLIEAARLREGRPR